VEARKPRLAALQWLIGEWLEETEGRRCDELWTREANGNMAGVFRWMAEGRAKMYEFMVLEEKENGLRLHLKHFGTDLVGWEEKDVTEVFDVIGADSRQFICISRNESPRLSITYHLTSDDELAVLVEKRAPIQEKLVDFRFRRGRTRTSHPAG